MIHFVLITQAVLECLIVMSVYAIIIAVVYFIRERFCGYYKNWKTKKRNQQWEKEHEEFMQRQRKLELEWKLYKKEREMYPLFYWKELLDADF